MQQGEKEDSEKKIFFFLDTETEIFFGLKIRNN